MKMPRIFHYDAFSSVPNKGNPAGVVFDAISLSEDEMQEIARKVGFNETVFVLPSLSAALRLRYFTPGHEISLCGHATMAALYGMKTRGELTDRDFITIETKAGVLPVRWGAAADGTPLVTLRQANPQFQAFEGDREALARSLGLAAEDLHPNQPVVYASTGTWTLLVPIVGLEPFGRMRSDNTLFPKLLAELPNASVHPFCIGAYDHTCGMHARHFSSPFSGTIEDPVTGTASGAMAAYALEYLEPDKHSIAFTVEQGMEVGRDGRVAVRASRNSEGEWVVEMTGTAVLVGELHF